MKALSLKNQKKIVRGCSEHPVTTHTPKREKIMIFENANFWSFRAERPWWAPHPGPGWTTTLVPGPQNRGGGCPRHALRPPRAAAPMPQLPTPHTRIFDFRPISAFDHFLAHPKTGISRFSKKFPASSFGARNLKPPPKSKLKSIVYRKTLNFICGTFTRALQLCYFFYAVFS